MWKTAWNEGTNSPVQQVILEMKEQELEADGHSGNEVQKKEHVGALYNI